MTTQKNCFLKHFSREELDLLKQIEISETFQPGQLIISLGERNRDIIIIQSGTAEIMSPDQSGQTVILAEISAGELLGEMNFVIPLRRTASIRAKSDILVIRYPYKLLCNLFLTHITLGINFLQTINEYQSRKLYQTIHRYSQQIEIQTHL